MTRKCIVLKCKSGGYESNKERISLFYLPKNEELGKKWIDTSLNTSVPLKSTHLVCEKHFQETDIIRYFIHKNAAGKIIKEAEQYFIRNDMITLNSKLDKNARESMIIGNQTVETKLKMEVELI